MYFGNADVILSSNSRFFLQIVYFEMIPMSWFNIFFKHK
jgi:hypothetical protein